MRHKLWRFKLYLTILVGILEISLTHAQDTFIQATDSVLLKLNKWVDTLTECISTLDSEIVHAGA